jgi:hypothetical protein
MGSVTALSDAEVINLEANDTSAAIRERVRNSQADRVLLVAPAGCPGLDNLVDLKLLSRYAAASDKDVALVIRDRDLREQATSLGFRAFSSAAWAQRAKWWQGGDRLANTADAAPRRGGLRRGVRPPPSAASVGLGGYAILALAFVAMLALLGTMGAVFVPTAKVTIQPVVYPVRTELTVQASPDLEDIDFINIRVPARVVEIEVVGSHELETTALRDEPEARASGEVVFTNRRSEATTIFSDTIVATSTGTTIRFRTTAEITVPPGSGSRGRAPIVAMEPGPSGNVPAYSINRVEGPLDRQVNVINVEPTAGGGMSQVRYVTPADKEQLRELSLHNLREQGYRALSAQLSGAEMLPPESLAAVVLSETYDKFPGEVGDYLNLHMRALVRGTVLDREDVELLGLRLLQIEVREGFQLLADETEVHIDEITDLQYDGTLTMNLTARGSSWAVIDELAIRESLRGKSPDAAEEYLKRHLSLASEPTVEVDPEWWGRLPWLPFRIGVQVVSDDMNSATGQAAE